MPGSSAKGKLILSQWFNGIPNKKFILDVGPGWGTYSKLLRKPGEVWHAVEIHEPYVARFELEKYYDKVYISDIRKFNPQVEYDVAILGDIVEHIENKDSIKVLQKLFKKAKWCIISLPLDAETHVDSHNSSDFWGNKHEEHIGSWANKTFLEAIDSIGGEIIAMEKYHELGVYLIATKTKENYTAEHITNPYEWFLSKYTSYYENKEENLVQKYKRKFKNRFYKGLLQKLKR